MINNDISVFGVEPKDKVFYAVDGLVGEVGTSKSFGAQSIMSHVPVTRNLAVYTIGF